MNERTPPGRGSTRRPGRTQEQNTQPDSRIASREDVAARLEAALAEIRAGDRDDTVETLLSGALEAWQTRGAGS